MKIRSALQTDSFAIATAHIRAWQEAYAHIFPTTYLNGLSTSDRAVRWEEVIAAAESRTDVAEIDGKIVAFVSHGPCRDAGALPNRGEIWAIYVEPSAWAKGTGEALLHHALAAFSSKGQNEVTLWVLSANERGRRFYEANGFAPVPASAKQFERGGVQVTELQYLRRNDA